MIIVSYDISDNKLRNRFSKFIKKFGHRLQYSVFEIDVSERLLDVIEVEIRNKYEKQFSQSDSIIIFRMSNTCRITRYGYASNDNDDIIIVTWQTSVLMWKTIWFITTQWKKIVCQIQKISTFSAIIYWKNILKSWEVIINFYYCRYNDIDIIHYVERLL